MGTKSLRGAMDNREAPVLINNINITIVYDAIEPTGTEGAVVNEAGARCHLSGFVININYS